MLHIIGRYVRGHMNSICVQLNIPSIYVKWWDIGPIFASLAVEDFSVLKHGFPGVDRRRYPCFLSPVFLGPDGPTVSHFFVPT